ncbi:MAG: helix-turn-helix transcriptional regulator [Candidatus Gastranaerophilales bacterium]|nr:helix-turn-helix transcriptional regulator [Candidatus Gastranaerophilales bacterium]
MQVFDKDYNSKIRIQIKKYRKLRGYSQELLAEKINRTREHINKIENGKQTVGLNTFIRLAFALGVSLEELAGLN